MFGETSYFNSLLTNYRPIKKMK